MNWSAATILPPRVRVPSTPSVLVSFIVKFVLYLFREMNENKQKEAGLGVFKKSNAMTVKHSDWCQNRRTSLCSQPELFFIVSQTKIYSEFLSNSFR